MLRLFFSRNRVFTKLDHQISRPASTQNLNRIFQTHPVMCDDDQLKEYLYEKQQAHLKNLTLCKNLKNWYFDQVVDQFGSDAGEKFKENCIIAPFGSSVTYLSTKDSDLDIGVFYQNYTDEMSLTDLVKFTDSTYIKNHTFRRDVQNRNFQFRYKVHVFVHCPFLSKHKVHVFCRFSKKSCTKYKYIKFDMKSNFQVQ